MYNKYADLLVNYCLEMKKGDRVLVRTTYLAEPLLRELIRAVTQIGGHMETMIEFDKQADTFLDHAQDHQLEYIPSLLKKGFKEFECHLFIRAPFDLNINKEHLTKTAKARAAKKELMKIYSNRTSTRELKRSLCIFPCESLAQQANMSMKEYEQFVFEACKLNASDPEKEWLQVRADQQHIVDLLNTKDQIRYVTKDTDISFSTEGRIWINSDGQTNMPSGEVYTSPVEDSVKGKISFSFPSIYWGQQVSGVKLEVENGIVRRWSAKAGQDTLDEVMKVAGARIFGEVAVGTNYNIQQATGSILFDEKMGGTIHMALGNSYKQTGGKNESSVHWDLITEMKNGGQIFADGEMIYENGKFIF